MLPYSKYTTFVMQFVLLKFICITKVVSVISWRFNLVRFLGDCGHMQRFNWQKNLQLHSLLFDFIHQNLSVLKVFSFLKRALVIVSKRSRIICNPKFSISNNFIYRDSSLTSPSLFLLWSDWVIYWTLGNFSKHLSNNHFTQISYLPRQFL